MCVYIWGDVCVRVGRAGFHVFRCAVQGGVGWGKGPHIKLTQNWGLDRGHHESVGFVFKLSALKIILD